MNKRNWTVTLIHHTHVDIGFTHTQDEVCRLQKNHIDRAMELVAQSNEHSDEAKFRWNPEVLWPVLQWLKSASQQETDLFSSLVRDGRIGLDGLYANLLTGLMRPEELRKSFHAKRMVEQITGRTIDSAMISDIPGWNWGLVDILSENGIRYLSAGPNTFDRIGSFLRVWGDRPFYWRSASNAARVLVYVHGKGYSWFHSGLGKVDHLSKKLTPKRIFGYLHHLERIGYPYKDVIIRYNIGADNGPPDEHLSEIVTRWNLRYPHVRLLISTASEAFRSFEMRYGAELPEFRGDLTPYWEDGAASTARETAIARDTAERLEQLERISEKTESYNDQAPSMIEQAWEKLFLYDEHTWGAHTSISRPDDAFSVSQWKVKQEYVTDAQTLMKQAAVAITGGKLLFPSPAQQKSCETETSINDHESNVRLRIYNTSFESRSEIVRVPVNCSLAKPYDIDGNLLESQLCRDGRLAILMNNLPANSARDIFIRFSELTSRDDSCETAYKTTKEEQRFIQISNGRVKISVDSQTGLISSIVFDGKELVNSYSRFGFNEYILMKGKWGMRAAIDQRKVLFVGIEECGPLVWAIHVYRTAPRTRLIDTTIELFTGEDGFHITNRVVRPLCRKREGVYFSFPLALPSGKIVYDSCSSEVRLNEDQLPGANHNFIIPTRYVRLANDALAVTLTLVDAPLIKTGRITRDPFRSGPPALCGWLQQAYDEPVIYSYIMNNYWMTNYKSDQPGTTDFRYHFSFHRACGELNTALSQRAALDTMQPLLVFKANDGGIQTSF